MVKWLTALSLLAFLSSCNLTSSDAPSPPTSAITDVLPTETPTPRATEPQPATETPPIATLSGDCEPRPDWFTYTVAAGDTLSQIASRTGTTVAMLIEGNCLADANTIVTGQQLLVPRPPIDDDAVSEGLSITPFVEMRDGTIILEPGATVTVIWSGLPIGSWVTFEEHNFLADGGVSPIGEIVGTETDSASLTYTVPAEINGQIVAYARLPGQNHETREADPVPIQTVGFADGNCSYVAPPLGGPHLVYSTADTSSTTLGEAQQTTHYIVQARISGNHDGKTQDFLQIDFNGEIGFVPENNVPLRGDCTDLAQIQ